MALVTGSANGNGVDHINEVALRRTRLVGLLRWATVCENAVMVCRPYPATQANSASYPQRNRK